MAIAECRRLLNELSWVYNHHVRIYLDACCLSRPFDDLAIGRNRLESETVLIILRHVEEGLWRLIGSSALEAEILQMPASEKRAMTQTFLAMCEEFVRVSAKEESRMDALVAMGVKPFDALHIACAEASNCDIFLTVDDQLLRKARELKAELRIVVANPLQWVMEQIGANEP